MKRFLVILSTLVCALGFSVISLASTIYKPEQHSFVHEEDGHYVLDVEVKASQFTEEQLTFWNSFVDALGDRSSEYVPFIVYNKSGNSLLFSLVKPNMYFFSSFSNGICNLNPESNTSSSLTVLYIDISSGTVLNFMDYYSYSKTLPITRSGIYLFWGYERLILGDNRDGVNKEKIDYVDWNGKRLLVGDDLRKDEPEEPDPPSSSSPAWIPPVVSDPIIPEGDEYVFYDTKILGLFLKHIRSQIVHAANVGWLIFGFILVWHVIKRVIKAFSSR